ncbi:hypothetical protein, partial [Pseudomonas paraeruginosa]|uniref:hypothetical protein n=1 Tax=Pseudomonas paraeruginosa TaxID=2994495 RepID=UPI0039FDB421
MPSRSVLRFTIEKSLSEYYHLDLALSGFDVAIDFARILNQPAHFTLLARRPGGAPRPGDATSNKTLG